MRSFLYVLPPESYNYNHPEGTGKSNPPFYSTWFVGMKNEYTTLTKKSLISYYQKPKRNDEGELKKPPLLLDNVQAIISRGFLQDKRPNPKQRKKNNRNKNGSNSSHNSNGGGSKIKDDNLDKNDNKSDNNNHNYHKKYKKKKQMKKRKEKHDY